MEYRSGTGVRRETPQDLHDDNLILDDENAEMISKIDQYKFAKLSLTLDEADWSNSTNVMTIDHDLDQPLLNIEYCDTDSYHCHSSNGETHDPNVLTKLLKVSFLCLIFMLTEGVGGYLAGSLAVMTDATHLLSDFIGFFVSIAAICIGKRPPTRTMTFGYHRMEVLGALASVLIVWFLAGIFIVFAVEKLWRNEYQVDADYMLIISSIGVVINLAMGAILHGICHTHSHRGDDNTNINVRAATAHVLGDLLQSVSVLTAAIVIKVFPNAKAVDPICTLFFSLVIVYVTLRIAKDAAKMLIEAAPDNFDYLKVTGMLLALRGVKHVHGVHMWTLSAGNVAFSAHLAVESFCDRDKVLRAATMLIRDGFGVKNCTIQMESFVEEVSRECDLCKPLL